MSILPSHNYYARTLTTRCHVTYANDFVMSNSRSFTHFASACLWIIIIIRRKINRVCMMKVTLTARHHHDVSDCCLSLDHCVLILFFYLESFLKLKFKSSSFVRKSLYFVVTITYLSNFKHLSKISKDREKFSSRLSVLITF